MTLIQKYKSMFRERWQDPMEKKYGERFKLFCSFCQGEWRDEIESFIFNNFAKALLEDIERGCEEMKKNWKPTCGYESEEEKGFQKGIMAEQALNNSALSTVLDIISKHKKELE